MQPQDEMWSEVCQKLLGITLARFDEAVPSDKQNIPYRLYYSGKYHHTANLPPLTLDALHEAEQKLQAQCKYWPDYVDELSKEFRFSFPNETDVNWSQMVHATKEQRLLALWRTIKI